MPYLYRGVHAHHPNIEEARKGIIRPADVNGLASAEDHNHDDRLGESPYTSWTHSRVVAEFHRQKSGAGGVLLRVPAQAPGAGELWRWEWSPNDYFEDEVLMRGVRMGVEVIR